MMFKLSNFSKILKCSQNSWVDIVSNRGQPPHSVQRGSNPHTKTSTPTYDYNPHIKMFQLNPHTRRQPPHQM